MGLFSIFKRKKKAEEKSFVDSEVVKDEVEVLDAEVVQDAEPEAPETVSEQPQAEVVVEPEAAVEAEAPVAAEPEIIKTPEPAAVEPANPEPEAAPVQIKPEETAEKPETAKPAKTASAPKKQAAKTQTAKTVTADKDEKSEAKPTAKKVADEKSDEQKNGGVFEIIKTEAGNFVYHLLASNHEIIMTGGEAYSTAVACKATATSLQTVVTEAGTEDLTLQKPVTCADPKFQVYLDEGGQFRFRLIAKNGKTVGSSEPYKSKAACKNGIKSVCAHAPAAEIVNAGK